VLPGALDSHGILETMSKFAVALVFVIALVAFSGAGASARVLSCGSFTAPGETSRSVRWDVVASHVSCRTAFPVISRFTKSGRVRYGWRCIGEDTLSRCRNGRWFVKATSRE